MGENKEEKKLSYEDLKGLCSKLQEQNQFLAEQFKLAREKIIASRNEEMYKRIDYLFKVLENGVMFDIQFVADVALEITNILKIEDSPEVTE